MPRNITNYQLKCHLKDLEYRKMVFVKLRIPPEGFRISLKRLGTSLKGLRMSLYGLGMSLGLFFFF